MDLPANVRQSFGLDRSGAVLEGGSELSIVTDGPTSRVVVKKVFDSALGRWVQWLALQLLAVDELGFRVPRPVRSVDGDLIVDGWIASEFVPGLRALEGSPERVAAIGRQFAAAATSAVGTAHPVVQARSDRWARGIRAAFDKETLDLSDEAETVASQLRRRATPIDDRRARSVVHCDLTGNVFVDRNGRPVVLDISPSITDPAFGTAVIVADHLLWRGGSADLVELLGVDSGLLPRALLFRLYAEQLADDPRHGARLDDYRRVMALLAW